MDALFTLDWRKEPFFSVRTVIFAHFERRSIFLREGLCRGAVDSNPMLSYAFYTTALFKFDSEEVVYKMPHIRRNHPTVNLIL